MTNPNQAVRLHSRNSGRASVYEANMAFQIYDNGVLTGDGLVPNSDLTVSVAGSATAPAVVVASNASGYKIALDIVANVNLTLTAPADNTKIVAIIAYTDDLSVPSSETDVTGNPESCGIIAVSGTASANPVAPTDAQIRAAITEDGATGSQASYATIALVTVASNTTTITDALIENQEAFFVKLVPESELDSLVGTPLEKNHFIFGYKES